MQDKNSSLDISLRTRAPVKQRDIDFLATLKQKEGILHNESLMLKKLAEYQKYRLNLLSESI